MEAVVVLDHLEQVGENRVALLVRVKAEREDEHVDALEREIGDDAAVLGDVFCDKCLADLLVVVTVEGSVRMLAEGLADLGHDVHQAGEHRRRDERACADGREEHVDLSVAHDDAREQPVAPVEVGVPQVLLPLKYVGVIAAGVLVGDALLGAGDAVVDPGLHGLVAVLQHALVAQAPVLGPRHDDGGVAPAGGAARAQVLADGVAVDGGEGDDDRHSAVVQLVDLEVAHPAAQEGPRVHVEGGRRGKDLDVARPAHLLALGAVGRDGEEVRLLAPEDVVLELVQARVAARELAGHGKVAADGLGLGGDELEGAVGAHADVAEAVVGEAGAQALGAAAGRDEDVLLVLVGAHDVVDVVAVAG